MSLLEKIKSMFSGGSSADTDAHAGHDHAGDDHDHEHGHDHTARPSACTRPARGRREHALSKSLLPAPVLGVARCTFRMSRLGGLCGLVAALAGLVAAHALALGVPPLPGITVTTPSLPVTTALPPPRRLPITTALPPPPPPPPSASDDGAATAPPPPVTRLRHHPSPSRRRRGHDPDAAASRPPGRSGHATARDGPDSPGHRPGRPDPGTARAGGSARNSAGSSGSANRPTHAQRPDTTLATRRRDAYEQAPRDSAPREEQRHASGWRSRSRRHNGSS